MRKNMKLNKLKLMALAMSLATLSNIASAGNVSVTNKATATLNPTCILSVQNMSFGVLTPGTLNPQAISNLGIMCSKNASYSVIVHYPEFSQGSHMVGVNHGDWLPYGIKDPVNGLGFEANGIYSNGFSDTGTGNTKTYGLIGSMANVPYITPDNYQGTVQVIVNY